MLALLGFIVTIIIVVGVHELGHFGAARGCGVRVLRFSIGFGKPLLNYKDSQGTEWCLGPIPLGGYVQMVDNPKAAQELGEPPERSLEGIPRWQRAWVIFAGPLANFVLAALLFFIIALLGETGLRATIGKVGAGTLAERAGFVAGEDIVELDGHPTILWSRVYEELFSAVGSHDVELVVATPSKVQRKIVLQTGSLKPEVLGGGNLLTYLGLEPDRSFVTLELAEVVTGSPAAAALERGDHVIAVNGTIVDNWDDLVAIIRTKAGEEVELIIAREGSELNVTVVPELVSDPNGDYGRLGVVPVIDLERHAALLVTQRDGVFAAFGTALRRTWQALSLSARFFGYLIQREVSTEHLSGPIGIAQSAQVAASLGLQVFLVFIAQISISLGLINLVPIPVLDGGHLLRYAIEGIMRQPLPDKIIRYASVFGVAFIFMLMAFAIYNDLT